MERTYTGGESLNPMQKTLLRWMAGSVGTWLEKSVDKDLDMQTSPHLIAYANGLSAYYRFGRVPIKLQINMYQPSELEVIDPDNLPNRPVRRFVPDDRLKERQFIEFAYTRPEYDLPESINPLEPTILVRNHLPYVHTLRDGLKPGEYMVDMLPEVPRNALRVATIMAGMHVVAASHDENNNKDYFFSGVNIASNPGVIAGHISNATGIPVGNVGYSFGSDFLASPGIQEIKLLGDKILARRMLNQPPLPNDDIIEQVVNEFTEHPMKFVFARAKIMPDVVATYIHDLRQNPMLASELFLRTYVYNRGNLNR